MRSDNVHVDLLTRVSLLFRCFSSWSREDGYKGEIGNVVLPTAMLQLCRSPWGKLTNIIYGNNQITSLMAFSIRLCCTLSSA